MRMRGGSGLGDAIYMRPIVEHFVRERAVTVCSDYPDVFDGTGAKVEKFDRLNIDVLAHYTMFKRDPTTNQWQDICRSAQVDVPLHFDWTIRNRTLIDAVRRDAGGRPVVLIHGGRTPMGRTDGFGKELLPERGAFDLVLEQLRDCFTVRIGKGAELFPLKADVDMNGGTTVLDLLDLGFEADAIVGQCSFIIPLAEAFDKPLLCIWSAAGQYHQVHPYIRQITPQKVLSKPSSKFVFDDWTPERIIEVTRGFR